MTEPAEGEFIRVDPPIKWVEIQGHPALNGHLKHRDDPGYQLTRISGPADRDEKGYPWDDEATEGDVDMIMIAHWWVPQPVDFDQRVTAEVQKLVDAFPAHEFTGFLDLFSEHTPLREYRRVEVRDRKAVITRPTVTWA